MNQSKAKIPSPSARPRARLLLSASLFALTNALAAGSAHAQSVAALMAASRHVSAAIAAASAPASTSISPSPSMASASARALQYQTQVNSALSLAQQAQQAARAAAAALQNPTGVADGLNPGGLVPAVAQITPLAADPTAAGVQTWQGASLPTASASNPNQVTIVQTAPRAVLSWTTFNVGLNTTLTFQQQLNGTPQPSWVALNRVVGQLNPMTGLRDASTALPSQILGGIKADGQVIVINQNGILFGGGSQVNVQSLVATSLEVGRAFDEGANGLLTPRTIAERDAEFLNLGLLGFAESNTGSNIPTPTFSAQSISVGTLAPAEPTLEGAVTVAAGAALTSADTGYLMLIAPKVTNSGTLSSPDGEVALQSGRIVTLTASNGDSNSVDPNVRGLVVASQVAATSDPVDYVNNTGVIEADRGYVSIGATQSGAVLDSGYIGSTTAVSANGYVNLFGADIQVSPGAVISIAPDASTQTIPQDATSLSLFKPSVVRIGDTLYAGAGGSQIDIGSGSLIYAPSANISIGADAGANGPNDSNSPLTSRLFIDSGAVIDAAGLTDVLIPASRNSIEISPVKGNELADSPAFRNGFLNGATVFVDPRLSGVSADGVAWVGSPLISAGAYAQQVGVTVSELMTSGGNVTLGALSYSGKTAATQSPDVIIKPGATIDISGGWKTYQAGDVQQSYLIDAGGAVVPISQANPDDTYVGLFNGYTTSQPRWSTSQTYVDPVQSGVQFEPQYSEGMDAGSLTIKASAVAFDGQLFAAAYPGALQILDAQPGTATGSIYGDARRLQAAPSQLPAGGYLSIQALNLVTSSGQLSGTAIAQSGGSAGGGDIHVVAGSDFAPLSSEIADLADGQTLTIGSDGSLSLPARPDSSLLPTNRLDVISLNADALSAAGLSELSLSTSGKIDIAKAATLSLTPGGVFQALAGPASDGSGAISVEGVISAPSGSINLTTGQFGGSAFDPVPSSAYQSGDFDIVITGELSVAGRWGNDFNAAAGQLVGAAYLSGGEITLAPAARVTPDAQIASFVCSAGACPTQTTDVSGSILIQPGALLDLSGGGYIGTTGALSLSATGGSLSLYEDTSYFQLDNGAQGVQAPGNVTGFRLAGTPLDNGSAIAVNPGAITARVSIANGTIDDHGFGGGGTFTLSDSSFAFGSSNPASGAALPLDFFSTAGFSNYKITTYETGFLANTATTVVAGVTQPIGGYDAFLETDVATVGAGQTLNLSQSFYSPILTTTQVVALETLGTGASLRTVLTPTIPTDAWDSKPVSLTLGGLTELHVAAGGSVTGQAGGSLTVGELFNEGAIAIPGGTVTQSTVLPSIYALGNAQAVSDPSSVTAAQALAGPIYVLGPDLKAGQGVLLTASGSIDLAGEAIVDPYALTKGSIPQADFTDGRVVAGGSLIAAGAFSNGAAPFQFAYGSAVYSQYQLQTAGLVEAFDAQAGAQINLAGASATFDRPLSTAIQLGAGVVTTYGPTPIWSNGGGLTLGSGGVIAGVTINAQGGAPDAQGGTLTVLNPVLYQSGAAPTTTGASAAISADMVSAAGFSTFVAQGELNSSGDVTLSVNRAVFIEGAPVGDVTQVGTPGYRDSHSPLIASGGNLVINASYVALDGQFQALSTAPSATPGTNTVQFNAADIDVTGAIAFDPSVGSATLVASQAIRLIGVEPYQQIFAGQDPGSVPSTLQGQLALSGNLTLQAGQLYPTTGTSFAVTSAASKGSISIQPDGPVPEAPYSAGGSLLIQAANIDQAGVVRAPLGALTLGSNTADGAFAPATTTLVLEASSTTSVSADGLSIPYGTTTDQVQWYFTPTNANPLTAPPAGVLQLAGASVSVLSGATVNLKGGGDVYAYEFVPGTGGSRDVLDQYNADQFSSNNGYQYPDGRQIYAIVPGLSSGSVAALDPVYSANYSALYSPSQEGLSVYFNAAPGLTAGWYTLLPAQYALLPGGMRVVQDTGAATPPSTGGSTLSDGTIVATGYFGVAGSSLKSSTLDVFDVQSQALVRTESNIALTSGNTFFAATATQSGSVVPQLPIDAARLIINPVSSLAIDATFDTNPAIGGRGSEVDVTGLSIAIDPVGATPPPGFAINLTDADLNNLKAGSLFIGGTRTDNANGTTSLDVTTNAIIVGAGSSLSAPEILLATDGVRLLTVSDGASIVASGTVSDPRTGDYLIDGLGPDGTTQVQSASGAFLRVSNGPERLVNRQNVDTKGAGKGLVVDLATLQGASVELDSANSLKIETGAQITAPSIALGASQISFGLTGKGLVITPTLEALLSQASSLSLRSAGAIPFDPGTYVFGNLKLDTPGLIENGTGALSINTGSLGLSNSAATLADCSAAGTCGGGSLTIAASQIAFGTGTVQTYGVGAGVTLTAPGGIFVDGVAGLDVGSAPLTMNTPFLGDRGLGAAAIVLTGATQAAPSSAGAAPALTLQSTGAVAISDPTTGAAFTAPAGTPGSNLTIDAGSVAISGAQLRATAGTLQITSQAGIAISGGAVIATPAYAKTFGDSADPTTVSAPGGLLNLTALNGDIGISDDSTLAIGGGQGQAGSLSITAENGQVYAYHVATTDVVSLASVFSAAAPGGGASLTLDTGGAFDLSAFAAGAGQQFTGAIQVSTGSGDLTLAAGDKLTATSMQLTANNGQILDAGEINTAGVNGGDVSLYGANGVHLTSSAVIDAHANGYGATDTRQASGGNVTLGADGSGAIAVDSGAVIDVAAVNTQNRLVPLDRTDGTYDTFVAGDVGGTVTFRAPVIVQTGGDTVNVAVQGSVQGASSVVLEGFQHFDLNTLASNPNYVGVKIANDTATLDLGATGPGQINALGDVNGPVVQFVQNFDVSADYGALGGLAASPNFHARPGVQLDYSGNITLASNWNLGAGVVNVAGAVAAGLMVAEPDLTTAGTPQYAIVPGAEAQIFAQYTQLTYRVGGTVSGEPGVLTLRAGGALTLNGSITDGFFQFQNQTDPDYLSHVLGGGTRTYQGYIAPSCTGSAGSCASVGAWSAGAPAPADVVSIAFPSPSGLGAEDYVNPAAPYSAAANSPSASSYGDPLGSAELFPLLGGATAVNSWSYQLVAGAKASVNPMSVVAGSNAAVTVQGQNVYSYAGVKGQAAFTDTLDLQANGVDYAANTASAVQQWLAAFETANSGLSDSAFTTIQLGAAPTGARSELQSLANTFFKVDNPGVATFASVNKINTSLGEAARFMSFVSANFAEIAPDYKAPSETPNATTPLVPKPTYAVAPTLVRTGTGSIQVAASGNIDLSNGQAEGFDPKTGLVDPKKSTANGVSLPGAQLGGTAIYTAGHIADLGMTSAVDVATGITYAVDLSTGSANVTNVFTGDPQDSYKYGAVPSSVGSPQFSGVLLANPVYADGGGSISLNAGRDVLSRRDTYQEARLGDVGLIAPVVGLPNWVGSGDQPWRTGAIDGSAAGGFTVEARINPQLFNEGVGTLGGGNIAVNAGRDISDLSTISTASLTTATATGANDSPAGTALVTLGGGSVQLFAGDNILGGRLDVASGAASVSAGGSVESAGAILENNTSVANTLRVRLTDATVSIDAGGDVTLQGVAALGLYGEEPVGVSATLTDINSNGFYSANAGVSIVADGSAAMANFGLDVIAPANPNINGNTASAVLPGSFGAVAIGGDVNITAASAGTRAAANEVLLDPSPTGTLTLLAGGDIAQSTIAMLDSDPTLLPGAFSEVSLVNNTTLAAGLPFLFPTVLSTTTDIQLRLQHNSDITHAGDPTPNRIAAGRDIDNLILSVPKQTRVYAGQDILNMAFFGQNVASSDITRIVAGRDITATTALVRPTITNPNGGAPITGDLLPAVQGDTFILGGPGYFFLEAGRDAGPFLTSSVTNGYAANPGQTSPSSTGVITNGNGIITVGNAWNPWLPFQGASIVTEFGVANGQNFNGLIAAYLDPASFASAPDYLFEQTTDASGNTIADRSQQVYSLSLVDWMRAVAPDIIQRYDTATGVTAPAATAPAYIQYLETLKNGGSSTVDPLTVLPNLADQTMPLIPWLLLNEKAAVVQAYGGTNITYQQAYSLFQTLPALVQREFLIKDVYFNELTQTSIASSPSYLVYSRGYKAVNTLFPAADGYTANSLNGGPAGASQTVETGNLDLRLATIQTQEGGDIAILGPGGRVLAGSTVSTSVQASRYVYSGGALFAGRDGVAPLTAAITSIPVGYEGVITQRGGSIDSFTDGDFLLNQSRAFTEEGGDIAIWSSNADVNAGQGPRTTADVPPIVDIINEDGFSQQNVAATVSGAGIGAFGDGSSDLAPDVFLIAPRGTVDAGAAGVRSAGNVFIAAFQVANADAIQATGTISGVQSTASVPIASQTSANAASSAASQAAQAAAGSRSDDNQRPLIFVDVLGFLGDESDTPSDCKDPRDAPRCRQSP
jgi:filamentous hemagglutinin family protein